MWGMESASQRRAADEAADARRTLGPFSWLERILHKPSAASKQELPSGK